MADAEIGSQLEVACFRDMTLVLDVRNEGQHPGTLYRLRDAALVLCASPGYSSGEDFASVGYEAPEGVIVLVVDPHPAGAELADLPSEEHSGS